jgi:uncharacterized membrane protein
MIKKNKATLILTSIVLLIPVVIGLILWDQLPEQIPSHWGINGEVDGWSSKPFTVFGFPCILLALHWICVLASSADPKAKDYHPKMFHLVLWICPVLSLVLTALVYTTALGYPLDVEIIMPLLVGLMFIIVGNLLPKCRQSYTMGIKLPWTLHNEENWNKTHRLGGKTWVIGGIITMSTAFIGSFWILLGVLIVMVAVPTVYSYCLYRKQTRNKEGE